MAHGFTLELKEITPQMWFLPSREYAKGCFSGICTKATSRAARRNHYRNIKRGSNGRS